MLKRFFPQFFFGEADGTEHEHANYSAIVNLALKLHDLGLLSCDTIQNFYNKKLRFKTEVFESARAKFKMLVDEVEQSKYFGGPGGTPLNSLKRCMFFTCRTVQYRIQRRSIRIARRNADTS